MITFVEVSKKSNKLIDQDVLEVKLTQLETSQDHIFETSYIKVDVTHTENLDQVFDNIAKTLVDYNKNEFNRYIFNTRVLYDRDGNEARTENTYDEKIRLAYRKLTNERPGVKLVQRIQIDDKEKVSKLHNEILNVLPNNVLLETHYIYGVIK